MRSWCTQTAALNWWATYGTPCVIGSWLLLRFTEQDLKKEDEEECRVSRFFEREGLRKSVVAIVNIGSPPNQLGLG